MPETHTTPTQRAAGTVKAASKLTEPQADFLGCMLGAVIAALPAFLAAFMECLGSPNNGGTSHYEPGDRTRCTS